MQKRGWKLKSTGFRVRRSSCPASRPSAPRPDRPPFQVDAGGDRQGLRHRVNRSIEEPCRHARARSVDMPQRSAVLAGLASNAVVCGFALVGTQPGGRPDDATNPCQRGGGVRALPLRFAARHHARRPPPGPCPANLTRNRAPPASPVGPPVAEGHAPECGAPSDHDRCAAGTARLVGWLLRLLPGKIAATDCGRWQICDGPRGARGRRHQRAGTWGAEAAAGFPLSQ